jgi:hypothetical protein
MMGLRLRERSRTSLVAAAWHAHPMSALVALVTFRFRDRNLKGELNTLSSFTRDGLM